MKYKIRLLLILFLTGYTTIHTKLPPEFQTMVEQHVQNALNAAKVILANKNIMPSQKRKLNTAVTALNTFQQTLENSSNKLIFAGLKNIKNTIGSAGGGLSWPHPSNKVRNLSASKNFISAEQTLRSLANTLPETVKMSSNPFNQWGGYPENSYQGYMYWLAKRTEQVVNNEALTKSEIAGMKKIGIKLGKKPRWTWELLVQAGYAKEAHYLRILMSEFYCARCAIGASAFNNGNLKPVNNWPDIHGIKSNNLLPGGFNQSIINDFITKATGYVQKLRPVRQRLNPNNRATKTLDPLKSFAGVIIAPTSEFLQSVGMIKIGENNIISEPMFFPYQQPSNASSNSHPNALAAKPVQSENPNTYSINLSLEGTIQVGVGNNLKNKTQTLCDLTLTSYKPSTTFDNNPLPFLLKSIQLHVDETFFKIQTFDKFRKPNQDQAALIEFFRQTPDNPWAFVISLSGKNKTTIKDGELSASVSIVAELQAIVQLSPGKFAQYTKLDLANLMDLPSNLYESVKNTEAGKRTPTARLLRGITNGYLSSWKYQQLKKPTLSAWKNAWSSVNYPTPSTAQFEKANPSIMLYGLYGCRQSLNTMYLATNQAIKKIEQIIKDPTTPLPGYQPVANTPQRLVTTVIQEIQQAQAPNAITSLAQLQDSTDASPSQPEPSHPKPTIVPTKTPSHSKLSTPPHKKTPTHKPSHTKLSTPPHKATPTQHHASSASVEAYKRGYRDGLKSHPYHSVQHHRQQRGNHTAIRAYKRGYRDGLESLRNQRRDRNSFNRQNERNQYYE